MCNLKFFWKDTLSFIMKYLYFVILITQMLALTNCDFEKYIGSSTSVEVLAESTKIFGQVNNIYTQEPVYKAQIKIGEQTTLTNENGEFNIDYLISDDEERNQPTKISITAPNFFPWQTEKILYPDLNEINRDLVYAAPIIRETVRVNGPGAEEAYIYQAIIKDYRGVSNIKKVTAQQYYMPKVGGRTLTEIELKLHTFPTATVGHYQAIVPELRQIEAYYLLIVENNDAYADTLHHSVRPNPPDEFIFDPNG